MMWKVLLLFCVRFYVDCSAISKDNNGYKNVDILREKAADNSNYPTTEQLPNEHSTREYDDNIDWKSSQPADASQTPVRSYDNRRNRRNRFHHLPYLETIGDLPYSSDRSDYDQSLHSLNAYDRNNEDYQLPRTRKRRPPELYHYPILTPSPPTPGNSKKRNRYRGNPVLHIEQMSINSELKLLLKKPQFSGFSLSEILQQRNLSLSDLLKGKMEVLNALRPADSENLMGNPLTNDNTAVVTTSTVDHTLPANGIAQQSQNLPSQVGTTITDVLHAPTTVTSIEQEEIMEYSDFPKREQELDTIINSFEKIRGDNIQNVATTTAFAALEEDKTFGTITKNGDVGLDPIDVEYQNEEPATKNHLTAKIYEEVKTADDSSPANHQIVRSKNPIYEEILTEIAPQARAEILELLNSSATAEKLEKLLKSRNMSLEELIALRQRGSSRLHLAQVKTTKSDSQRSKIPEDDYVLKHMSQSSVATDTPIIHQSQPIVVNLTSHSFVNKNDDGSRKKSEETIQLVDLLSAFESIPFTLQTVRTKLTTEVIENLSESGQNMEESTITYYSTTDFALSTLDKVRENVEFSPNENNTLSKLKPSIFVSKIILGMAIITVLIIFIVLRIRRKQKIIYGNAFPRSVFRVPVVNSRKLSNSSSSNIMINVVTTSAVTKRGNPEIGEMSYESDIENDSLDTNDSWDTIPDFRK